MTPTNDTPAWLNSPRRGGNRVVRLFGKHIKGWPSLLVRWHRRSAKSKAPEQDLRQPQFVPFTNGLGLQVTPGRTPRGDAWFVRAAGIPAFAQDGRHTVIESVSGATPIEAAQRAIDSWGQEILFRDPAQDERDEKARNQVQEAQRRNQTPQNIRPGDRR